MSLRLRDLIRQVRACKTAAEERAVIAKESAMIRTAIREEQEQYRHRNVAKLLFMHMLGYPTHFGQLECMKLIASPHFPEKRIGYLGMMLLLSEEADVLMLATNSLKNDLNSDNKFVSGLALCAIGNLATADMSRDLAPEVDKHLKSSQPYLRKKACLAMCRCLMKCPEMVEDFFERFVALLKDRSHGVLITVVQLMTQVVISDAESVDEDDEDEDDGESPVREAFLRLVPSLVKLLRNLLSMGYSPDHDVGGISDPFLQVQILTLLRLLGVGDEKASEEMNDVLAQVATNTETSKNAGNAILYECVQTIMGTESEDGLRVLAVNILGRFLLNRDNNIRYVALNTLSRCIAEQKQAAQDDSSPLSSNSDGESGPKSASSALQRHRTTIVDCLKDPDISIRQRALELIYHLVNQENVESLTAELLNYLVLCPREHRADICTRVLRVVDRFSPDDRWKVDTLITMLTIAGRECTRSVQSATIVYISRASEDLRAYSTHKLLKAIRDDDGSQRGLLVVGIWCIGEFGDLLLKPYTYVPPSSSANKDDVADVLAAGTPDETPQSITFMGLEPGSVVTTVDEVTKRHSCPEEVKETALTCFVKLSDRFAGVADQATLDKLEKLLKKHEGSHALELQLRSCEYGALLNAIKGVGPAAANGGTNDDILGVSASGPSEAVSSAAKDALARMPVVDIKVMQRKRPPELGQDFGDEDLVGGSAQPSAAAATAGPSSTDEPSLLDLNDIFAAPAPTPAPTTSAPKQENGTSNGVQPPAASAPAPPDTNKSDVDLLSDIFSAPPAASPAPPVAAAAGGYDPFSAPASQPQQVTPAIPAANTDIFGAGPAPIITPTPSAAAADPLGSLASTPAAPPAPAVTNTTTTSSSSTDPPSIQVPGFTHGGLTVTFHCTKPDTWNKQISTLTTHFQNTTDTPIYGLNFQCAVPKYVTMELKPPTSTTIPPGSSVNNGKKVTQTITVTNGMLGTKNLMLKVKVGFTVGGKKVDYMGTCSGFPAGQY